MHAQSAGGAWSARVAAARIAVWLVNTLPDAPAVGRYWPASIAAALAQGDRIIAPSIYAATPVMKRHGIADDQITIIPREIDTAMFDPLAVSLERSEALRSAWRIPSFSRIVLVPGRLAPWNGQIIVPDVLRALADAGQDGVVFVLVGEHSTHRAYAREIMKLAQERGVDRRLRLTGHCPDMPAAFAAADLVAVTALEPPLLGSVVAQAQAMARPVVTTDVGMLPEHVLVPPRMPEELRTGWVVAPADPIAPRPYGQARLRARSDRIPGDGGARAPVRRIHVLPAKRRGGDPRRLYVAPGARSLICRAAIPPMRLLNAGCGRPIWRRVEPRRPAWRAPRAEDERILPLTCRRFVPILRRPGVHGLHATA